MATRTGPSRIGHGAAVIVLSAAACAFASDLRPLSKARYLDKCKGAWAGQMIGVCFGGPTEFKYCGKTITGDLPAWTPSRIAGAINQDDCYVEMTFLSAIEKHGLDLSFEQAGRVFGESKFNLWHANLFGRNNIQRGIMPPLSGHPSFNRHADDIDFQIESDVLGILCPGLPDETNRLCDIFGHIMNYGDGVYGGMFVAGMYAAAYFEDDDVSKVVQAGLACVPPESQYYQCISDVIGWHREHPEDWLATWKKIEEKWQDNVDCSPGHPLNIDAKINGAYIVVGLLYGGGDLARTLEICTRCGQDSDCNPSNAAGVLGCMKGFSQLEDRWIGNIGSIADTKFSFTDYSFNSLVPACQAITEQIIRRTGGQITGDMYQVAVQAPRPPATLEQWTDQKRLLSLPPVSAEEMEAWAPGWRLTACGPDMGAGINPTRRGRTNVLVLHPVSQSQPAVLEAAIQTPGAGSPRLVFEVAADKRDDFLLKIFVNDKLVRERVVDGKSDWAEESIDLSEHAGKNVVVRIEDHAKGWVRETAFIRNVSVEEERGGMRDER